MPESDPQRFRLDTPADPEYLATARLFVATVARTVGVDEDSVEDLKLATSEAVAAIVMAGRESAVTVTAVWKAPAGITVEIGPIDAGDLSFAGAGPDPLGVIEAVFPGASIRDRTIRFEVRAPRS